MGVKRGVSKTTKPSSDQTKTYLHQDNKRVRTLLILHEKGRMNQNRLQHTQEIKRGTWKKYNNILTELENYGLLKSEPSEYRSDVKMFDLTDKGKDLAKEIITLVDKFPELENFETFFHKKDT